MSIGKFVRQEIVDLISASWSPYWVSTPGPPGPATSPGAPLNSIQFNSGSAFSGSANFTFINSSNTVYLTGSLIVSGAISASLGPNTVGFYGTASWAVSASHAVSTLSSSYALSASYVPLIAGTDITIVYGSSGITINSTAAGGGGGSDSIWKRSFGSQSAVLIAPSESIATGTGSVAFGALTTASGDFSFAHGNKTIALGTAAHAAGNTTNAYGDFSFTHGEINRAKGLISHGEGYNTKTYATGSHTEGEGTRTYGIGSHAEGYYTTVGPEYGTYGEIYTTPTSFISSSNAYSASQFILETDPNPVVDTNQYNPSSIFHSLVFTTVNNPRSQLHGLVFQILPRSASLQTSPNRYLSSSLAVYDSRTRALVAHLDLGKWSDPSQMDGHLISKHLQTTSNQYDYVRPDNIWYESHTDTLRVVYSATRYTVFIGMMSASYDGTTFSLYLHNTASYQGSNYPGTGSTDPYPFRGNNQTVFWTGSIASPTRWTGSAPSVQFSGSVQRVYPPMTFGSVNSLSPGIGRIYKASYNPINNKTYVIHSYGASVTRGLGTTAISIINPAFQQEYTGSIVTGSSILDNIRINSASFLIHGGDSYLGGLNSPGYRSVISGSRISETSDFVFDKNGNVWAATDGGAAGAAAPNYPAEQGTTAGNPIHIFSLKATGTVSSSNADLFGPTINIQNMGLSASVQFGPYYYPGDGSPGSDRLIVYVLYPYGSGSFLGYLNHPSAFSFAKFLSYDTSGVLRDPDWGNVSSTSRPNQQLGAPESWWGELYGTLLQWWNDKEVFVYNKKTILDKNGKILVNSYTPNNGSRPANLVFGIPNGLRDIQEFNVFKGPNYLITAGRGGTNNQDQGIFWIDGTRSDYAGGTYAHSEGANTLALGHFSHAEGVGTKTTDTGSHAEGEYTLASGIYSHAEGQYTTASGIYSHAEGYASRATGPYSHAEQYGTLAYGYASHAEGAGTSAGQNSHAEGQYTTAAGLGVHSEGANNTASGEATHTEGVGTATYGYGTHAEGGTTMAEGIYTHAEGISTKATKAGSHAEGYLTVSSASYSHAEGINTITYGSGSHAEGSGSEAVGNFSHASGIWTIASGSGQTTLGKYNLRGNDTSLFVIGDGADNSNRRDLLRADVGVVRISGSLIVSNSFELIGVGNVTGSFIVSSSLNVIGTSNVTGSNNITGSWNLIGTGQVTGSLIVSNSFSVIGTSTVTGTSIVSGSNVITGSWNLIGTGNVTGSLTVSNSFAAIGNTSLNGTVNITGSLIVSNSLNVIGRIVLSGSFIDTGSFNLIGNGVVSGALTVSNSLNVIGTSTVSGSNIVSGSWNLIGSGRITGSLIVSNSLTVIGSSVLTGSMFVTGAISASLGPNTVGFFGTASWAVSASQAVSASYAISASYALSSSYVVTSSYAVSASYALSSSFATTASFAISASWAPLRAADPQWSIQFNSGSLLNGSAAFTFVSSSSTLYLTGSAVITGSVTASKVFITSSGTGQLRVQGSGSDAPIVTVLGSQGYLVDINDSLTGSLLSVQDISGFTIFDVNSDRNVYMGDSQAFGVYTSRLFIPATSGSFQIYSITTSSYTGMFVEYTATSQSNARAGSIMSIRNGSSVNYTETTTTDFGDTLGLTFLVAVSSSLLVLSGSVSTPNWTIKSIIRSI